LKGNKIKQTCEKGRAKEQEFFSSAPAKTSSSSFPKEEIAPNNHTQKIPLSHTHTHTHTQMKSILAFL
jgi:hypothetical protein